MAQNSKNQKSAASKHQNAKAPVPKLEPARGVDKTTSMRAAADNLDSHVQESHEQMVEIPSSEEGRILLGMKASRWSGPLPHPEFAREYEGLCPGALDRLLSMVERQSDHRQEMEKLSVQAQIKDLNDDRLERKRGQIFGLVIALAFILVGGGAAIFAENMSGQIAGAVFGGTGAIGLVSLFVIGKEKKDATPSTNGASETE